MIEIIKLLIIDDHPVVRSGLLTMLSSEPDMEIVGMGVDGFEAVEKALALKPDVILLDLVMPRKDGVQAIIEIIEHIPEARILVLTSFGEDQKVVQTIQAGALGFILKESGPEELVNAIRSVYHRQPYMQPQTLTRLMRGLKKQPGRDGYRESLTNREIEILKVVARGHTNHEVAHLLSISERTVTKHISNILDKLQLNNRTQIAFYAAREGLLDIDDES